MGTTNYYDTFITVAEDSTATEGVSPPVAASPSVAARTWALIHAHPYEFTSDDVIFTVHADRKDIDEADRAEQRAAFFSKGQACLRASDLGKRYGWGIHSDAAAKVALVGVETATYDSFVGGERQTHDGAPVAIRKAMRAKRA